MSTRVKKNFFFMNEGYDEQRTLSLAIHANLLANRATTLVAELRINTDALLHESSSERLGEENGVRNISCSGELGTYQSQVCNGS